MIIVFVVKHPDDVLARRQALKIHCNFLVFNSFNLALQHFILGVFQRNHGFAIVVAKTFDVNLEGVVGGVGHAERC